MAKPIEVSVQDFRANMAEFLRRASFGKERIVITYHGKPACALVPLEAEPKRSQRPQPDRR